MSSAPGNRLAGFAAGIAVGALVTFLLMRGKPVDDPGKGSARPGPGVVSALPEAPPAASPGAAQPVAPETLPPGAQSPPEYAERLLQAMSIKARHDRLREFLVLLQHMDPGDGPAVIEVFDRLDRQGGQYPAEWIAFVTRWGELNGPAAAEHHLGHIEERWALGSLRSVFAGWARTDPQAAVEFINREDLPDTAANIALTGLIAGVGEESPADAARIAVENVNRDDRRSASRAMEAVAEAAVRNGGTEEMMEVFDALPHPAWKNAGFGHVWWRMQHSDPDVASQWLVDNAGADWASATQYRETIEMKARHDPEEALDWAAQLPVDLAADQKRETFAAWKQSDAAAAEAWLQGQSEQLARSLAGAAAPEE